MLVGGVALGPASQNLYFDNYESNDTGTTDPNGGIRLSSGAPCSQFCLTEAPSISGTTLNSKTQTFPTAPPVSCGFGFTTRMLMGYMGYIGHISETFKISVYSHFIGAYNSISSLGTRHTVLFSGVESVPGNDPENPNWNDSPGLFSALGANRYTLINSSSTQEFSLASSTLQYTIYEPTLSCGTTNGLSNIRLLGTSASTDRFNYSGPQYKFSMLGRMYDLKLFGPFTAEKYTFLDSMTIPCNSEGFYEEGGVDKDFWVLPTGNHVAFLMPKT